MEKELEQFQQEAQRLKTGRRGGSLPFPETLRAFAVRYAAHTLEAGGTVVEAAQRPWTEAERDAGAGGPVSDGGTRPAARDPRPVALGCGPVS